VLHGEQRCGWHRARLSDGHGDMILDLAFGLGPATLGIAAAATGRGGPFLVAAGVATLGLTQAPQRPAFVRTSAGTTWFTDPMRPQRRRGRRAVTVCAPAVVAGAALWRPERAARVLARMLPGGALFYVDTDAKAFALTFDDGPHRDTTPPLLDVLGRHGARATFFLIGELVLGNEPIVRRIAAEGHELANHLMRDEPSVLLPDQEFRHQLAQVSSLLAPYGDIRWFRPGSGWFTPRMLRSAAEQDLRCVLGTVVARGDASGDARIARRLLGRIQPGSIAVLHEGTSARRGVVSTTDRALTELGRRGLSAVTVSDLVALRC